MASYHSNFVKFLGTLVSSKELERAYNRVVEDYALGATRNGSVIFWQIDKSGNVRTGKIIQYDAVTGRRDRQSGADWIHARMKREKLLKPDFRMVQCLFGEHLLNREEHRNKLITITESEKSAIIGSMVYPKYLWLSCGGSCNLTADRLSALKGRRVVIFPDVDAYPSWRNSVSAAAGIGISYVSDLLEKQATDEERQRKIDIADWIVTDLCKAAPWHDS